MDAFEEHMIREHLRELHYSLRCPVCLSVFNQPLGLACENSFCKDCLLRSLAAKLQCRIYADDNSGIVETVELEQEIDDAVGNMEISRGTKGTDPMERLDNFNNLMDSLKSKVLQSQRIQLQATIHKPVEPEVTQTPKPKPTIKRLDTTEKITLSSSKQSLQPTIVEKVPVSKRKARVPIPLPPTPVINKEFKIGDLVDVIPRMWPGMVHFDNLWFYACG